MKHQQYENLRKHLENKFDTSLRISWGGMPDEFSIILNKSLYDDNDRNLIKRIARYLPCCMCNVISMTRGSNVAIRAKYNPTALAGMVHSQLSKM